MRSRTAQDPPLSAARPHRNLQIHKTNPSRHLCNRAYAAVNLSLVTWIIRSYMLDIPKELEDAARTDGAGDLRILREIIVPACLPGIITAAVIAAIFAINEFLFTLLIASTEKAYTMSVALANFTGGSDGVIYNAIALVSFLAFMPILILVILIQKHLSRGLTMGAVKG